MGKSYIIFILYIKFNNSIVEHSAHSVSFKINNSHSSLPPFNEVL